ncbi:MAG: nitroreductase family protein [Candidatus Bathyarchaeia archaeon]|nr:nitroreductase family protein [Candidatus Bathyarchaeia archaeon]
MEKASSLLNIIKSRRSIRRFKFDSVPREYLDMILEVARWAPSAGNCQPWRFIVVSEVNILEKIGEIYQDMRAGDIKGAPPSSDYYKAMSERVRTNFYKNIFTTAPLLIVVCADAEQSFRSRTWAMDCSIATQNMLLMAHALGLGSVIIDFQRPEHETLLKKVRDLLGVPDGIKLMFMLPVGYPDEEPAPPRRMELSQIVYLEKYGHK